MKGFVYRLEEVFPLSRPRSIQPRSYGLEVWLLAPSWEHLRFFSSAGPPPYPYVAPKWHPRDYPHKKHRTRNVSWREEKPRPVKKYGERKKSAAAIRSPSETSACASGTDGGRLDRREGHRTIQKPKNTCVPKGWKISFGFFCAFVTIGCLSVSALWKKRISSAGAIRRERCLRMQQAI